MVTVWAEGPLVLGSGVSPNEVQHITLTLPPIVVVCCEPAWTGGLRRSAGEPDGRNGRPPQVLLLSAKSSVAFTLNYGYITL